MSKQKEEKTNVMRVLDQKRISYTPPHAYPVGDEAPDSVTAAKLLEFEVAAALRDQIIKLRGDGK